ncbi:hypothetical protein RJ639_034340 [Escallonia herrerae]|uniref:Mlo protein n=1 Tax=Escallonia herrerae TaxID=1293975 RepID=A0AA89BA72_9ASTE|nr:hypothetical protein RJ639_034340 [Escallonia herrerae]
MQYSFGLNSCFHERLELVIAKVALGAGVLILCSYITLPLYALVPQMGSNMKRSIFDEQTSKALKKWHMAVKKRQGKVGRSPTRTLGDGSASPTTSTGSTVLSQGATLHRLKTTGHSTRSFAYEDREASDVEGDHSESHRPPNSLLELIQVRRRPKQAHPTQREKYIM